MHGACLEHTGEAAYAERLRLQELTRMRTTLEMQQARPPSLVGLQGIAPASLVGLQGIAPASLVGLQGIAPASLPGLQGIAAASLVTTALRPLRSTTHACSQRVPHVHHQSPTAVAVAVAIAIVISTAIEQ